jgi:hypothetical protein
MLFTKTIRSYLLVFSATVAAATVAQAQTAPGEPTTFGPIYPAPQQSYELDLMEHATVPGQDKGTLQQDVANKFAVHIEKLERIPNSEGVSLVGSIAWSQHSVSTTVNGVKADPDIKNWNDDNHRASFEVTCVSAKEITKLELKPQMPEMEAGVVAFLSSTMFPEVTANSDETVALADPFSRRIFKSVRPGLSVTLQPRQDGVMESKPNDTSGQTQLRIKVAAPRGIASVEEVTATKTLEVEGAKTQKVIEVRLLKN